MLRKIFILFRIIVSVFSVLLLAVFVENALIGILNIGNICGGFLCLWLLFVFATRKIYVKFKEYMKSKTLTKVIFNTANFCITAFLIYGLVVTSLMFATASIKPDSNSTAIVLGAQVQKFGPSAILWGRINSARDYLAKNEEAYAVVTGGQGDDEPMSEGQCMYEKLIGYGIPASRIYIEDKAVNTQENFEFSYKIIEKENLNKNVAIVTDFYHQLRARIIARKTGIKGNVGAVNNTDTSLVFFPTFVVREWFALPYQLLFR